MLNRKTKERIAINKSVRSQPKKRVVVLQKRMQKMPSSQALLSVKHMPDADVLADAYITQIEALYKKWDLEDNLYYGRARRCQALSRHSSKTKKKAQIELWRNLEPKDAEGFAITSEGEKRDLKEISYLDILNLSSK